MLLEIMFRSKFVSFNPKATTLVDRRYNTTYYCVFFHDHTCISVSWQRRLADNVLCIVLRLLQQSVCCYFSDNLSSMYDRIIYISLTLIYYLYIRIYITTININIYI